MPARIGSPDSGCLAISRGSARRAAPLRASRPPASGRAAATTAWVSRPCPRPARRAGCRARSGIAQRHLRARFRVGPERRVARLFALHRRRVERARIAAFGIIRAADERAGTCRVSTTTGHRAAGRDTRAGHRHLPCQGKYAGPSTSLSAFEHLRGAQIPSMPSIAAAKSRQKSRSSCPSSRLS